MNKIRIDNLLVERGLADSREKAKVMVMEGAVIADNRAIIKPSTVVLDSTDVRLLQRPLFVSRGGLKLDGALAYFEVDVSSKVVVDIGASTGGFTDCLLKRGASRIYAVDVGYGQLDFNLRQNPGVVVMERINARYPFKLPELVDLAVVDVAFISLTKVVPTVANVVRAGGELILLIKPQFEAERGMVGRGGVIRDPRVHAETVGKFICWAVEQNFRVLNLVASQVLGAEGNREFFILLGKPT